MARARFDVRRPKRPSTNFTSLFNAKLNRSSLGPIKSNRRLFQQPLFDLFSAWARRQGRSTEPAMMTIDRASLVAVDPGSVRAKRDEIGYRGVVVIEFSARHKRYRPASGSERIEGAFTER